MNLSDTIEAKARVLEAAARPWAARGPAQAFVFEFVKFGVKQAWACLFGGAMLAMLFGTHLLWPDHAPVARYDVLVVASIGLQALMLATKLERWEEAVVIAVFHVVGTLMEIFKTAHGSWIYPEESLLRIGGVPLFSGFMYACVGSYMARAMRVFDIRFVRYPPAWTTWVLAIGAYVNFFTHHYVWDARVLLFAWSALIFGLAWIEFTPDRSVRRMPILLGFVLVAFFIWIAENVATFASAWIYPSQRSGWVMVPIDKMGSWYLLMMLSFVLVTLVHPPKRLAAAPAPRLSRLTAIGWRRPIRAAAAARRERS